MPEKEIKKCAHPGCKCPAVEDSDFCGAYCEGAADHPSIACGCAHPECSPG